MHISNEELNALLRLQKVDREIARSQKEFGNLQIRKDHADCRAKISQIDQKAAALRVAAEKIASSIEGAEAHDADLKRRLVDVQASIDGAGTDYRSIEQNSKKLVDLGNRVSANEAKLERLYAESEKAQELSDQIDRARAALVAEEARLRASFEEARNAHARRADELSEKKDELEAALQSDVLKRYRTAAARGAGVGVALLEDGVCGACRTPIEHGHLIDLRSHAPLGDCPNCGRLLIVV